MPSLPTGVSATTGLRPGMTCVDSRYCSLRSGNGDVEQMDLVVARDALAVRIDEQRGVRHAPRRVTLDDRGAAEDPHAELARGVAQELLNRPRAVGLRHTQLVGIAQADEREVLRQAGKLRAGVLGLAQKAARRLQVFLDAVTRGHLNCSNCTHSLGASAVAVAASALLIRSTVGLSQLPVIR